ncbi:hypothetical protein SHI21_12820 [Bacteriovorax sp. PP10]|uniref:Uncharacterized protein n=1 Tax=Bacteriovorax antarcticus TaxID=3088717 RepID=A0ABU5VVL2_9BACT|nr:hypothetical protein [Bacteriovorax sp. PP10]MEA9357100.1 hypothetical protein [Bacteriovorax sp. PP10]
MVKIKTIYRHQLFTFLTLTLSVFIAGCVPKSKISVNIPKLGITDLSISITNVKVVNHQIIITGHNLNTVTNFKIREGATNNVLQIESQTKTSLVANTISNVTFAAGRVFDFILSNASAASTFTVDFSLCDSTLGGKSIACNIAPTDKQVLSYDAATGKWRPRSVNGLGYKGVWGSLPALPAVGALVPGDYFIINVAHGAFNVGDWIVLNDDGVTFEQVENSTTIVSVFGRSGAIVATKNDYHLDLMGDVDLTTSPPIVGDGLVYNGVKWVAGPVTSAGATGAAGGDLSGTYPNPTIGNNKITDAHIANAAISQTKINGLATSLSGKEPSITAAATTTYFRGDKTFVTLNTTVVAEGTNLYFTNARALGVPLAGFNNALTGQVAATDSVLQAFGRVQNQINSLTSGGSNYLIKNAPDTLSGAISLTNVITATGAGDIVVNSVPLTMTSAVNKTYADGKLDKTAGGTVAGVVTLDNDLKVKGGTNYVTIKGHATSANYNLVLPSTAGTAGYVLSTDGSGNTSWITAAGGGAPTGAAGGDLSGTYPNPTITALDAAKVGGGAVSNTEFSYLDGVTSSIQTQLTAKEPAITAAATTTYLRGDKTFVTLNSTVVPEGTNLYFTNARALGLVLAGFDNTLTGQVAATDTMLQAFGRVQNQINSLSSGGTNYLIKNGPDTISGAITLTSVISATSTGDLLVNSVPLTSTSAVNKTYADGKLDKTAGGTVAGVVTLDNDLKVKGGTNYVTIKGHATSANYNFVLPSTAGTAGYVLSTDGSGNTSWVTVGGGGAPSGAAGGDLSGTYPNPTITALDAAKVGGGAVSNTEFSYLDGVTSSIQTQLTAKEPAITAAATTTYLRGDKTFVTLNTTVVPEGTNLYFTNARALGLVLAGFDNTLTGQVAATDTMLEAFGRVQNQINSLSSGGSNYLIKNAPDTLSGAISLTNVITATGAGDIVVNSVPLTMTSAVNKTYADGKLDKTAGGTVAGVVTLDNDLKVKGGTNYVTIKGHATSANYNLVLPSTAGTAGYVLSTDGSGNTSWITAAGGGAPTGAAGGDLSGTYPNPTITALDAAKVGGGAVSNTEFSYLDGVTSSIQTQLNAKLSAETDPSVTAFAKAALPNCSAGQVLKGDGTSLTCVTDNAGAGAYTGGNNFVVVTDGSGALSDSTITTTKLGYLSGVSSDIQTQLNAKQATISKTTTQDVSKIRIYGANATNYVELTAATLTGNRSLIFPDSDGTNGQVLSTNGSGTLSWSTVGGGPTGAAGGDLSGTYPNPTITALDAAKVGGGAVSNTEFSYLDGVTSSIQTQLTAKEPAITAAATTTYLRGDKTFVTLNTTVVPEGTNLYFTNARALGLVLTGFDNTLTGQVAATDTMLQAFGRVQNQINSLSSGGSNYLIKNGPDTLSGAITLTNVITASGAGDIIVNSVPLTMTSAVNKTYADGKLDKAAGGTVAGVVTLDNDLKIKGGSNYVTIKGHATSAAYNLVLPSSAGTAGYVLSTDGSGNTSWITAAGGGAPTGAAGGDLSGTYPNPTITALDAAKVGGGAVSNAEFSYLDGVTSSIQTQLAAKQATISKTTTQDVSKIRIYGANATNYVELSAATLTGNRSLIFPDSDGTTGQALTTNGSGVLSWTTVSGGGAPTGAAGGDLSGTYPNPTITALDAAKVGGGAVSNTEYSYLDGVTSSIQTQLTGKEPAITAGTTAQYLRGDKSLATFATDVRATTLTGLSSTAGTIAAGDTVLAAFGKMLNTQSDYVSKSGSTTVTGSFNIVGITAFLNIPTPTGATLNEAANVDYVKTYVDAYGQWTKSGSDAYRSTGNVSIGSTPVTNTKLNVEGQIRSKSFSGTTGAIDWANGNSGTTSYSCAANLTFANLRDGGSYILAVTSTATTQCSFSTTTTGDDAGTVSYRFIPANAVRTASTHTIYSLQRIGSVVYVSWITGF